jgi:hypothetical protein
MNKVENTCLEKGKKIFLFVYKQYYNISLLLRMLKGNLRKSLAKRLVCTYEEKLVGGPMNLLDLAV